MLQAEPALQLVVLGRADQDADGLARQLGWRGDRLGHDQRVGVEALRDDHVDGVSVPIAPTTGGLPTPLIACSLPLRISAIAVTPASNGTKRSLAGIVLARLRALSMMLSELATVPWP